MNDTLLKYVKEKLAEQRSICADAFWNNYFNWIDNVPTDKIKALMQFIEAVEEPNIEWLKKESFETVYKWVKAEDELPQDRDIYFVKIIHKNDNPNIEENIIKDTWLLDKGALVDTGFNGHDIMYYKLVEWLKEIKPIVDEGAETSEEYYRTLYFNLKKRVEEIKQPPANINKWVSVEERKPDYGEIVLLWHKSQITYALGCWGSNGFYFSHIYLQASDSGQCWIKDINPQDITHWMPLPESPNENKFLDEGGRNRTGRKVIS